MSALTPPPAGWYPDPQTEGNVRWWSGSVWTAHVAPLPPVPPSPVVETPAPERPFVVERRRVYGHDMLYVLTAEGARAGSLNLGTGKLSVMKPELAPRVLLAIEEWRAASAGDLDVGVPGASARAEHQRRRAKHEEQIEAQRGTGRIGKIAKACSKDPQSTEAWATGAVGEERLAEVLSAQLGDRAVMLHDRHVPGSRGNIDHVVIASSGVWVIDAKRYRGKVERRDVGGFRSADVRLYVAGRDRTRLVHGLAWQVDAVRSALGKSSVPVHACLSFVDAEWPLFSSKPFQLHDVWISRPVKLAEMAAQPGPLGAEEIQLLARALAERFPAKVSAG